MICEWEAQILLTWSISYDNLHVLIMVMVYWYFKTKSMVWIHPFFDGIGLITNQILMIDEWEAHYILTRSISYDIFGILIMVMVYWYFKLL
jgi:hypothetical protein